MKEQYLRKHKLISRFQDSMASFMEVGTLHGSHHHQSMYVYMNYCEALWTKASDKCHKFKCKGVACNQLLDKFGDRDHNLCKSHSIPSCRSNLALTQQGMDMDILEALTMVTKLRGLWGRATQDWTRPVDAWSVRANLMALTLCHVSQAIPEQFLECNKKVSVIHFTC